MAIADSLGSSYLGNIGGISKAFAPVDSSLLNKQLSGAGLGNTLGFGVDGISTLGLTPEDITKLIAMRGAIQNQNANLVQDTTNLADLVSGNKETRAAMMQANRDIFNLRGQEGMQEAGFGHAEKMENSRQAFTAEQNRLTNELAQRRLDEDKRYHNLYFEDQAADRAQRSSQHKDLMNLRREEMIAVKNSASNAVSAKDTTELIAKLGALKTAASKDNRRDDYFRYHMMESSMTATPGTIYDLKDYSDMGKGYKQLMLGPDNNWYGITRGKDGKISKASETPIVYNPISALGVASSTNGTQLVHKYQPTK